MYMTNKTNKLIVDCCPNCGTKLLGGSRSIDWETMEIEVHNCCEGCGRKYKIDYSVFMASIEDVTKQ